MSVSAPGTGLGVAAVAGWVRASLLVQPGLQAADRAPLLDEVAIGAPVLTVLRQMALAGLAQLRALLPVIERQLAEPEPRPAALGHLARAVGDAAHQLGAGLAAEPGGPAPPEAPEAPGPAPATLLPAAPGSEPPLPRGVAHLALQRASTVLEQVSERLQPGMAHPHPTPSESPVPTGSDLSWALIQLAGAQRQVAASLTLLADTPPRQHPPRYRPAHRRSPAPSMIPAAALIGTLLLLALTGALFGLWLVAALTLAALASALWAWRTVISARTLRLRLRRP